MDRAIEEITGDPLRGQTLEVLNLRMPQAATGTSRRFTNSIRHSPLPDMIRPTIILLASIFLVSARPTQALAQAVPPAIASIRMRFAEINKDTSNFRRVRIDMDSAGFERESTDGGEVEAYFDGHEMRRATATYFGEHGSAIYDIYYQHRRPFFVHVVEKSSGEKLYGPQHIEKEIRIYLDKGSLIRFMIGQKLESVTERENLKTANVARELAAEIVRRVK